MKASEQFKVVIENYLNETALNDTVFATNLSKTSKNIENCINYIFGEVKKTGLCAFDNQEIFDMALIYYTDDTILPSAPLSCKVFTNQPVQADLFNPASINIENAMQKTAAAQTPKTVQTALTLFDL